MFLLPENFSPARFISNFYEVLRGGEVCRFDPAGIVLRVDFSFLQKERRGGTAFILQSFLKKVSF